MDPVIPMAPYLEFLKRRGEGHQPEWTKHWPDFVKRLEKRLATGHAEYGDESFAREPVDLLNEIIEEVDDIVGWGFVLGCRLQRLKEKVREAGGDDQS